MLTTADIAAYLANPRNIDVDLSPSLTPWGTLSQTATASNRSRILEYTPTTGGWIYVDGQIEPIIKLYYAGPTEIPAATKFYFGVQRADKGSPDWTDAVVSYRNFAELAADAQQSRLNRGDGGTLVINLGKALWIPDGDKLVIDTDCTQALNPTLSPGRFEFKATVGRL